MLFFKELPCLPGQLSHYIGAIAIAVRTIIVQIGAFAPSAGMCRVADGKTPERGLRSAPRFLPFRTCRKPI